MEFSRKSFDRHAHNLEEALQAIDDNAVNRDCSFKFRLSNWKLKHYDDGDVCLVHPPIFSNHHIYDVNDPQDDTAEETSMEDDSVHVDRQCCGDSWDTIEQLAQHVVVDAIQWNFSVVYNETFEAPVLYFYVQRSNGEPCSRQYILAWLKYTPNFEDSWEVLSQEEHPLTGLPSYFLHPCQTHRLLRLLLSTANGEGDDVLWMWLSLVLATVGRPIPAGFYARVQNQIRLSSAR